MKNISNPSALSRFAQYMRPWRQRMLLASTYSVVNKLFDIAPEILIGVAVDLVVKREDSFLASFGLRSLAWQLGIVGLATLAIWAFESLFQYLHQSRWRNLAQDVQHEMRLKAFGHVQSLEMAWFEGRRRGELSTILSEDVNQVERFLNSGINDILQVVTSTLMISGIFFYLAPSVALFAMLPIPLIVLGAGYFQRRLEPRYREVRDAGGQLGAQLSTALSGLATIKSYTAEDSIKERVAIQSAHYQSTNRKAIILSSAFVPLIRMAILAGFLVTLVLGGIHTLDGRMAVGAYSVLVFLTQRLLWPFTRLGETVDLYQRSMASMVRVLELLAQEPEKDHGQPQDKSIFTRDIELEHVHFSYPNRTPTLSDLNLRIRSGEFTGLVGLTGSGKSTLFKLLLRFYVPSKGRVSFDGVNSQDIQLSTLRQHIGLVSQDTYLLHGTIADNIALGQPGADRDTIRKAAEAAEIDTFIQSLTLGYDSPVGEHGELLSGGQRQRIAIARAILKDPPILLLDEATSAVDNETEAAITRAIGRLAQGRTVLAIAHRLSTLRHADKIHVLGDGQVLESGTHEELLRTNGSYARLWAIQSTSSRESLEVS